MTQERYDEICAKMDSSMASVLNLIRQYIQANQASVMVGAGFSKNADLSPGAKMKDWNELAVEFYKQLYVVDEPSAKDLVFKSPIRLASQLSSYTTHSELDKVISIALPDKAVNPGELHRKLMQLPWRDVFTTNYDTLLERTRSSWKQNYEVVTNRETLIYSKSPRIIKLHGSFPDQHPFIITEEDFRTYPKKHPEFVNTVRQSLIENLFCLIGFSGDDENFLSWIGWLRDVIGKDSVLCYLITYNQKLHDSEASLMKGRGITPVNLKDLPLDEGEGISEAIDFFLSYMAPQQEPEKEVWNGSLGEYPYENLEDEIPRMKKIRESYPDWPFLPAERLADFKDIERRAPFIADKFNGLEPEHRFQFTKELLWRIQVSYSSLRMEWLVTYLESIVQSEDLKKVEVLDFALALLSFYRKDGDFESFKELYEKLNDVIENGTSIQVHSFVYETALCYIAMLNLPALIAVVAKWDVSAEESIPALWKANVLTFLGEKDEAKVLLEAASSYIESQFRTSVSERHKNILADVFPLVKYAITGVGGIRAAESKSLYLQYSDQLKMDLLDYENKGRSGQQVVHSFKVGHTIQSWRSGASGMFGDYIYPFRYVTMRERLGMPMGSVDSGIDIGLLKTFLIPLLKYEPAYVTSCVVRSMNADVVKTVFTRESLHKWDTSFCEKLYKSSFRDVFVSPNTKTEERLQKDVLIPLFSRMCIRFNQEIVREVFDVTIAETIMNTRRYDLYREELSIIYDCAVDESLVYMLQKCIQSPIPSSNVGWEIPMPPCQADKVELHDAIVDALIFALGKPQYNESLVVSRLRKLWKWMSKDQQESMSNAIIDWRLRKTNFLTILTYTFIRPKTEELDLIHGLCDHFTNLIDNSEWYGIEDTNNRDNILEWLENLIHLSEHLESVQLEKIYASLRRILEDVYGNDGEPKESMLIMGAEYYYVRLDQLLRLFVQKTRGKIVGESIGNHFFEGINELIEKGAPLLEVKLLLKSPSDIQDDKRLLIDIKNRITSKNRSRREDGVNSMLYVMTYRGEECDSTINNIVQIMRGMNDNVLVEYLRYCIDFLLVSEHESLARRYPIIMKELLEMVKNNDLPFDFRTDISYYAGHLAGIMSCAKLFKQDIVEEWEVYIKDSQMDSDVRLSFDKGIWMFKNKEKLQRYKRDNK